MDYELLTKESYFDLATVDVYVQIELFFGFFFFNYF